MPKPRKYDGGKKRITGYDKNGYAFVKEVYYKPDTKGSNFDFSKDKKLMEYRAKAFAKPEPQADEYYEGELVGLKAVGL